MISVPEGAKVLPALASISARALRFTRIGPSIRRPPELLRAGSSSGSGPSSRSSSGSGSSSGLGLGSSSRLVFGLWILERHRLESSGPSATDGHTIVFRAVRRMARLRAAIAFFFRRTLGLS